MTLAQATPLLEAITKSDEREALALIAQGADIHTRDQEAFTPLNLAVYYNLPYVVEALIEKGADVNACERNWNLTPLMHAAEYGRTDIARMLIAAGADVAQQDNLGKTAADMVPAGGEMEALLGEAPVLQRRAAEKAKVRDISKKIARLKARVPKFRLKAGP